MRTIRLICFCLSIVPFLVGAQQYNFRNYNVEDGLGQSQVYAMHQDKTGRIWLGTRGSGINIFDGFNFKALTKKNGLPSNYINDIVEDEQGIIWVATNNGLSKYNGISFSSVKLHEETIVARDLFLSEDGLYCATSKGLFLISDDKIQQINSVDNSLYSLDVLAVYKEKSDIWLGTDHGLYRLNNGKLHACGEESVFMKNAITTIQKGPQGNLWIGTYGDGLYCYNRDQYFRIDLHHELYRQTVFDIHFEEDQIWIATLKGGVVQYDVNTKIFRSITEQEGLSNNHVRCILKDLNGLHWFGTSGGGLCHYLGKQFTNYDEASGLAGNYIYSVLRDRNGHLWIGNSQRGVSVLKQDGFTNYNGANEFKNVKVKALTEDNNGNVWLGTDGQGVYVYKDDKFEALDELNRAYVKQMTKDQAGNIWIATAGSGLIKVTLRDANFIIEKWTTKEGILSNRLTSLHFDKKGRLWYGTENNGVGCLSPTMKNILHLDETKGLPSNLIRSLSESNNGRLWIGTAGGGICGIHIYDQSKKPLVLGEKNGLRSNNVYLLTVDDDNSVIVGSEKGLDFVFFNEKGTVTQIKHYGKLDGFTGVETCQNSVWNDANGSIWFGTINGLCHFNPAELINNNRAPLLSITDVKIFYESYESDDDQPLLSYGNQVKEIVLPYSENHITFEFLGVNMSRPEGVFYRWKLVGFDEDYAPPSKDRSILYSNLNPGKYTFELIASNEDGIWNEQPLTFSFEIQAPFWQTTWFIILCVISGLGILLLIYTTSIKRIQKKAKQKEVQLKFERDFLELQQKAMRLQMNPHFIFNALNSIQSLIGTGKEKEARYYLAKFSRLMRQILDNSRKSEITLEEEIDTLENYLLVEQFCNGDKFSYSLEVDPSLETDFINIPPMLVQPFVENAIKHGMKGAMENKTAGKIIVRFEEKAGILECIIEDNGIGREKAAELNKASKETYHTSTGLSVTTERLERIDPERVSEPLKIIDLYDGDKATGTRVIIRIPID